MKAAFDGEQMSIFEYLEKPFKITKPIRLIELFAGIGSQAMALRDIGANFEHWRVVEFDKYAIASYNAIHGTNYPTLDITQITGKDLNIVDTESFTYILTYSFPCTDLSLAGTMGGEGWYKFPKPIKLKKRMSDYLEEKVDEKYFLTNDTSKMLIDNLIENGKIPIRSDQDPEVEVLGGIGEKKSNGGTQYYQQHRVYNRETLCPALNASGTELAPKILDYVKVRQATDSGYTACKLHGVADLNFPKSTTRRGRVIKGGEISPTLTTHNLLNVLESGEWEDNEFRYLIKIRFLTPREYWRLMGFTDEDFEKARAVNSDRQLYKQAGNSIVKNVLCEVFRQMIESEDKK